MIHTSNDSIWSSNVAWSNCRMIKRRIIKRRIIKRRMIESTTIVSFLFLSRCVKTRSRQGFAFRALTCLALPIDWQSLKKCFKFVGNYFVSFFPQRNIPNWQWNNPIHEIRFSKDNLNFDFTTFCDTAEYQILA